MVGQILSASDPAVQESCYRLLLRKYWKLVAVLAASRLGDGREAEDVTQEAFFRAFSSLRSLSRPAAFLGWLLRIARNLATDRLRKRKTHVSLDPLGEGVHGYGVLGRRIEPPAAELIIEREEEVEQVLQALRLLPEKYREVVALRYLEEMDGKAMARLLGEPEGTLRNRLFRALEMLRESLLGKRAQRT